MVIRQATLNDISPIMELVKAVVPLMNAAGNWQWDDTYPNPAVFEKDISLHQLWLADIEGAIVGIAAITTDQDAEYAQVGWDLHETAIVTHRLAVTPDHQGKGIAVALMEQAEKEAVNRHISVLRVDTNSRNVATQKLFPKLGYLYAGEIDLAFRPGLRFYCYEKRLFV
ncbi:GCN5 family acetyltransferase [Pedobacter sp. PACM 27299]|uniref:GNAT family N-acetyltransferase n=1 Tax=Pedobacter sp. PACM 27299 TaxID=1727164 RepID=UPI000706CF4A|nr:GNAT family N-acetyltransferase [Pedobacter sp. PACM 27299]ALL05985.1 GCN5 family acetyltransferase [Pedobacter sp. PACM 27299]